MTINMKKISFKNIGILILVLLVMGSCKKWIDTEINNDPDNPVEVTMGTLLPAIEARLAFTSVGGNDVCRTTSLWIQQLDGIARQSQDETNYRLRAGDVNNLWNDAYAGHGADLQVYLDYAEAAGSPHNLGVGQVLLATTLGFTTDVFGDMPYSEAFQGTDNLKPSFDSQESIYNEIMSLLDQAISNLGGDDESGVGIQGDYLYDGDEGMWLKAAYALKARYTLHLSKRNDNAYSQAMGYLANAFTSNDDDMQFNYGAGDTESNPLYQFMRDRGDVVMCATFIDLLKDRLDPRLTVFALPDGNGEYTGSEVGSGNADVSLPGPAIAGATAPTYFVSYQELLFIKAECQLETGAGDAAVRATLVEALEASLEKYGVYDAAYVTGYEAGLAAASGAALRTEIFTHKYIALCYQMEAFNDWRRSANLIGLSPNPVGAINTIPRRFPYPTDEVVYNPDNTPIVQISDRVWWDVN